MKDLDTSVSDLQIQCYREGREVLPYFPNVMNIETTNRCNLSCTICPGRNEPDQGFLDVEFFEKRILPELPNCPVPKFWLHFNGEPLLHPHLERFIESLNQRGLYSRLSTNGILMRPSINRMLIRAQLKQLVVSLDAASAETYKDIRGSKEFDQIVENVRNLIEAKQAAGSEFPQIQVQMVRWSRNDDEVERFVEHWNREGIDSIYFKPLSSRRGALDWALLPNQSAYLNSADLERSPCFYLWDSVVIRWNGKVSPCCADLTGEIGLGDLHHSTLWEIWNDLPLRSLRRAQFEHRFDGLCQPCQEWANETGFPGREPLIANAANTGEILGARGRHIFIPLHSIKGSV